MSPFIFLSRAQGNMADKVAKLTAAQIREKEITDARVAKLK
jgi:hypothetical protein